MSRESVVSTINELAKAIGKPIHDSDQAALWIRASDALAEIKRVYREWDKLVVALDSISGFSCHLRAGGPDSIDLYDLSYALNKVVGIANDAIANLGSDND